MINLKTYIFILMFNIIPFSKFVNSYQVFDLQNPDQNLIFSTSDSVDGPIIETTVYLKIESNVLKVMYSDQTVWTSSSFDQKVVSIQTIKAYATNKLLTIDTLINGQVFPYYFRWLDYSWKPLSHGGFVNINARIRIERILDIKPPFDMQSFEIYHDDSYGVESTTIVAKDPYNVRKVKDNDNTVWTGNMNLKCKGAVIHGPIQQPALMQLHLIRLESEISYLFLSRIEGIWVLVPRQMYYSKLTSLIAEEEQGGNNQNDQNQ